MTKFLVLNLKMHAGPTYFVHTFDFESKFCSFIYRVLKKYFVISKNF